MMIAAVLAATLWANPSAQEAQPAPEAPPTERQPEPSLAPSPAPSPAPPEAAAPAADVDEPRPSRRKTRRPPSDVARRFEGSASAARAAANESAAQQPSGFAFEAQLGNELSYLSTNLAIIGMRGGFLMGLKTDRTILGVGLDVTRVTRDSSEAGVTSTGTTTAYLALAGARVAFAQSDDYRVEMFGQLDLGIGGYSSDLTTDNNDVTRYLVQIGPGLRFWPHRSLAIGAVTLYRRVSASRSSNGTDITEAVGFISTAIEVLAVF